MADITYSTALRVDKGLLSNSIAVNSITATMAVAGYVSNVYPLSGVTVSISTASLSAVGMAMVQNVSASTAATCLVSVVSGANTIPFAAPRVGEVAVLRLASGVSYVASGTSGARLRVDITEG